MSRNSVLEGKSQSVPEVQDTQQHILDVALRLMQTGGYHAFSYADIAAEVGITKASIHYHYPSKAQLGHAALRHYRAWWQAHLRALDAARQPDAAGLLRGYILIYRDQLRDGRLCLVAALSAESPLLPPEMQAELAGFYSEHEDWLSATLEAGQTAGTLRVFAPLRVQAQGLISALHGALGLARVQRDVYLYCAVAHLTLAGLGLPISELELSDPRAWERSLETGTAP